MCTQSIQNAEKLYRKIKERIASLDQFLERGQPVKEVTSQELREIRLHHFRIIYRCTADKVQVLTVYHGSRLFSNNPHLSNLF